MRFGYWSATKFVKTSAMCIDVMFGAGIRNFGATYPALGLAHPVSPYWPSYGILMRSVSLHTDKCKTRYVNSKWKRSSAVTQYWRLVALQLLWCLSQQINWSQTSDELTYSRLDLLWPFMMHQEGQINIGAIWTPVSDTQMKIVPVLCVIR